MCNCTLLRGSCGIHPSGFSRPVRVAPPPPDRVLHRVAHGTPHLPTPPTAPPPESDTAGHTERPGKRPEGAAGGARRAPEREPAARQGRTYRTHVPAGQDGRTCPRPGHRGTSGHLPALPGTKDRAGPGGVQRDLDDVPASHRYDARWGGRPSYGAMGERLRLGAVSCPVVMRRQGCFRPRCAAAEYPQAVRGPLPRGIGDVHRACGWT